jgi:hypothetical protein
VSKKPLASLQLSVRTINALEKVGVTTIGELVDRVHIGSTPFRGTGGLTGREVQNALDVLSEATNSRGTVDWISYARTRGFLILPVLSRSRWSARQFLEQFPTVVTTIVDQRYGERAVRILEGHFLASQSVRVGLRTLGKQMGQTHQLVSLIEARFITMLRRAIWLDDYRGCRFRIRSEFLTPLREMGARLEREGIRVFSESEWDRFFTYEGCKFTLQRTLLGQLPTTRVKQRSNHLLVFRWESLLCELWGVTRTELDNLERLLLQILGFQLDVRITVASPLVLVRNKKSKAISLCARELVRILRVDYPNGATADSLLARLKKKFGRHALTFNQCLNLLESQPALECTSKRIYRARLTYLGRTNDRIERVLREEGKILHHREIAAKLAVPRADKEKSIRNRLSYDPRFVPIGRSGFWGLAEWKAETGSIADVAASRMRGRKRLFTEAEILKLVLARRPCASNSINATLVADRRFVRAGPLTWKLSKRD